MGNVIWLQTNSSAIFGKNSNSRTIQTLELVQPRIPADCLTIDLLRLPVPDRGCACAVTKSIQETGASMGVNDYGVAISVEPAFTRIKHRQTGLSGLVMLQSALMSAQSAEEALQILITLLETQGQGGACRNHGSLPCGTVFLLCDRKQAFVFETAGNYWAWKEAGNYTSLGNSYTITTDFKRLDAYTRKMLAPVNDAMACLDEADAGRIGTKSSWKQFAEHKFLTRLTQCDSGRAAVQKALHTMLSSESNDIIMNVMELMRSHKVSELHGHAVQLCNHNLNIFSKPTASSMLVQYMPQREDFVIWFTGAPYTCANLYKPILCHDKQFIPLWVLYDYNAHAKASRLYWQYRKEKLKNIRKKYAYYFYDELQERQKSIIEAVDAVCNGTTSIDSARTVIRQAVEYWDTRMI